MSRKLLAALVGVSMLAGAATGAQAVEVAFFDNPSFTDPTRESALLSTSLSNLGHSLTTFSGITATDFTAATSGRPLLVIPELDNGDLNAALDNAARTAIFNFVNAGGALLMFDRSSFETPNLLNAVFGFSLTNSSGVGTTDLNGADAAGTPLAGGPATLPNSDATEPFDTSSLPAGAKSFYDDGTSTTVFAVGVGAGQVGFLGFDWFEDPTPSEWEDVLGRMVEYVTDTDAVPVPEPSALVVLAGGLAAMWRFRRRPA